MNFDTLIVFIGPATLLIIGILMKLKFKSTKRSAENIYKLIDDLEKKYIY